jgi:hypothetical protein
MTFFVTVLPHNMIEVKRGLAPEVKVSSPPADWVPDCVKREGTEPASFLVIDNPGGWGQCTFRPKFHNKAKGKDIIYLGAIFSSCTTYWCKTSSCGRRRKKGEGWMELPLQRMVKSQEFEI